MPYDPKRPRRALDDDAPVEALLTEEIPVVEPEAEAEPKLVVEPEPELVVEPEPEPVVEAEAEPEPVIEPEPEPEPDPAPVDRSSGHRTPAEGGSASSVPVAPAPTEQTANLAVAGATGAAALLTLIILLLLRRRARRNGAG
jgi:outer membrane biosynthesis protein TonB